MGVGAHGFTGHQRYWNTSNLQEYIPKAVSGNSVIGGFEDLTQEQLIMEKVLFGLRMNEGIPQDLVPENRREQIQTWVKDGFLLIDKKRLKTTVRGQLVLDELSLRLI